MSATTIDALDYLGLDFAIDAAGDLIGQLSALADLLVLGDLDRAVGLGLVGRALADAEALETELLELDGEEF